MRSDTEKSLTATLERPSLAVESCEPFATHSRDEGVKGAEALQETLSPTEHVALEPNSKWVSCHLFPSEPQNLRSPKERSLALWLLFTFLYVLLGIAFYAIWQKLA
jgi:hypothetical protein